MSSFGFIHYWRVGDLGCLRNASGMVWCLSTLHPSSNPLSFNPLLSQRLFFPSSLPSSGLPPTRLFQLSFSRWTSLPQLMHIQPPRPHIHHPLHPCPAQSSYRVPGRNPTGMGHAQGRVFTEASIPVQLPGFALSSTPLFQE